MRVERNGLIKVVSETVDRKMRKKRWEEGRPQGDILNVSSVRRETMVDIGHLLVIYLV